MSIQQKEICKKYGSAYTALNDNDSIYVAIKTLGQKPINGKRYKTTEGFSGWKIWAGNEEEKVIYTELKIKEIESIFPEIIEYLGLSPGYSFEKNKKNVSAKYNKSTKYNKR